MSAKEKEAEHLKLFVLQDSEESRHVAAGSQGEKHTFYFINKIHFNKTCQ